MQLTLEILTACASWRWGFEFLTAAATMPTATELDAPSVDCAMDGIAIDEKTSDAKESQENKRTRHFQVEFAKASN